MTSLKTLLCLCLLLGSLYARDYHKRLANDDNLARSFGLLKLNEGNTNAPTLLLVGGIHGDEPGAYYATDVFLRHYKITKGSVWVVPVANPHGMFANMRGVYGDMNRKFAALSEDDPDYPSIQAIKDLLAHKDIDISMHLHDGSGYWRPIYHNALFNQHRWGNCSVIDQPSLEGVRYGEIESYVTQMVADINEHLLDSKHRFHVHNTHTKAKNDIEQLKALTFYSLSINKPALTNEASKELSVPMRVFYHLLAIESLLGQLGISFERDFHLSPEAIAPLISPPESALLASSILLPLHSLRQHLGYIPLPSNTALKHISIQSQSDLLGLVQGQDKRVELKYGSRTLSSFLPEWREFDTSLDSLSIRVDGVAQEVDLGSLVHIKQSFSFEKRAGYRINIIGFVMPNAKRGADEAGIEIYQKDFIPTFSLDTQGQVYRAEVYKDEKFSGMVLLSFAKPSPPTESPFIPIVYSPAKGHTPIHEPLPQSPSFTPNAKVKVSAAFVRIAPSQDSAFVAKAPLGRILQVLEYVGEEKEWAKVYYLFQGTHAQREIQGYIATRLLAPLQPISAEE